MRGKLKPYVYLAPSMLVIALVFFFPVVQIFRYSSLRMGSRGNVFIGFGNYVSLFQDEVFRKAVTNNFILLISVPVMVVLALLFSVLLFERLKGWRVYRTIFYMPYLLAIPVVGIVFSYIFQLNGILNQILEVLHLDFMKADWLGSPRYALWTVMFVVIWKEFGFGVVLFLARLMSVDEQMYEAAELEGASWGQVLIRITIPQLALVIEFFVIIMIITMLSWVFNYVYVMTSGGPGGSTMVSELYIYLTAFRYNQMGKASAAAIILLFITVILIIIRGRVSSRLEVET
ncbi:MAG: sugar ABC transporter permease [Spirochaetales bacterium]|nr:MAG: sugar ABC transporter permease [Spirochaetales bacterium]